MKNKYDDALQEAFLKSAFEEAARQDIAELEAMNIEVRYPTEKQKREIQREIRKVERGSSRGFSRFGRAVAMIAIVCCLVFGTIMTQPAVRASVWDVVVSFFEKYLSFDFDKNETEYGYQIGDYQVTYVPDGYILDGAHKNPLKESLDFKNGNNTMCIVLYPSPFNTQNIDIESGKNKSVSIGDYSGYLISYDDSERKELTWGNGQVTFFVRGIVSEKEILRIAESIQ